MQINRDQDVANKIEQLEAHFRHLHTCILNELMAKEDMNVQKLLQAITLLPTKLKKEYEKAIADKLPILPRKGSISELFLHLNSLFSFLEYNLLKYIIETFGSSDLQIEMQSYCCEIRDFMKQTTVQQLIDSDWPCATEDDPNISKIIAKIDKDPQLCNLSELDALRRRICIHARLSDVICALVSACPSKSFIVVWRLPAVLASQVRDIIKETEQSFFINESITSFVLDNLQLYSFHNIVTFGNELKQRYQIFPIPVIHSEWIDSSAEKIFKLAVIQRERVKYWQADRFIQMTLNGRIDDILHMKIPVELENIFKGGDQFISIEGAPGSGKSTLTIHICQRWGKGELFQQFTIVILVQLRDPEVQRAQTIADLLPVENVTVAQELATELVATNGRGVLWVLDGWDELPPHLQQHSIFRKLVQRMLSECFVIVTSRPISSGDLHRLVSLRIEVLGFTPEEQRQYFTECLKGDTKALEALLEKMQENPVVQSSCYLPLNAALTVNYFKIKGSSLPNTEYEIFLTNVLHYIHYHCEGEGKDRELSVKLESLDDFSKNEAMREPFLCLCELAYHGVMKNKVTFCSSDLPQGSNTLGLLQATKGFLQNGKSVYFSFIHLSFQELLAGYYIATCLQDSEQVSQFQQLFCQPRFISVFRFYTAMTKLKTPGINKIVTEIVSMGSESHLFSLLHCLYEAQDPLLCQFVAEQLKTIYARYPSPTPLDLLSIGYLISVSNTNVVKEVNFALRLHGDYGVKILMKHIIKFCGKGMGYWKFNMSHNNIHKEGAASIAEALQCSAVMDSLNLTDNLISGEGLLSIAKALITNTSLVKLNLCQCSAEITEENGPVVTEMLQRNKTLKELDLMNNDISDTGVYFIAEGLKKNSALKCLKINTITAQGGKILATAISTNTSLVELELIGLEITDDSGPSFVGMFQRNKSLERVSLSSVSKIGMQFIAEGLQQNSMLKTLAITGSSMTSNEAKALSVMLTVNETLTSMDLSENQIGDDGAVHLAEALRKNKSLQELVVLSCNITDTGLASLVDALRVNNSLIELDLGESNVLTVEGVTYSETVLSHRVAIIHFPLRLAAF